MQAKKSRSIFFATERKRAKPAIPPPEPRKAPSAKMGFCICHDITLIEDRPRGSILIGVMLALAVTILFISMAVKKRELTTKKKLPLI